MRAFCPVAQVSALCQVVPRQGAGGTPIAIAPHIIVGAQLIPKCSRIIRYRAHRWFVFFGQACIPLRPIFAGALPIMLPALAPFGWRLFVRRC